MVKRIGQKKSVLEILCERESVFQRLPQTNPENLCSNHKAYTISPKVRDGQGVGLSTFKCKIEMPLS